MSSDQRAKKLRGSGGYIIATVNDEQQRKGSLGGPDLFLAPIGRLPPELISRYFCNTCEKEYEGGPRIDYESPNETVAENLILIERGQYACTTCGSAIAEYRKFSKPDESSEAGLARPISAGHGAAAPPESPVMTPPPEPPNMAPPSEPPSMVPPSEPPSMAPPESSFMETGSISSISGMAVFDENGLRIGEARQVGVDSSKNIVLVVRDANGADVSVPWNSVKKIGEIILLGSKTDAAPGACPGCNYTNKADSKFCEQCGNKL